MTSSKENHLENQNGQTFVEFIFLLILLVSISFSFMRGFNALIGARWEVMLKVIAKPNASEVSIQ